MFTGQMGGSDPHHTSTSCYDIDNTCAYGTWAAEVEYVRTTFHNFQRATACGREQVVFRRASHASDYIPLQQFFETTFDNVSDDALLYIDDPPASWAGDTDCVGFPCTAPNNVVMTFEGNTFEGDAKPTLRENFF